MAGQNKKKIYIKKRLTQLRINTQPLKIPDNLPKDEHWDKIKNDGNLHRMFESMKKSVGINNKEKQLVRQMSRTGIKPGLNYALQTFLLNLRKMKEKSTNLYNIINYDSKFINNVNFCSYLDLLLYK